VVVVSYGITSRIAMSAVRSAQARREGGTPAPGGCLAIPGQAHARAGQDGQGLHLPELNMGQMVLRVERAVAGAPAWSASACRRFGARAGDDCGRDPEAGR